ncbi:rhomboid family intramembrane serine protease [Sphingomonas sp. C3-2]|uniref:rhomboid family intramembrane serine protease n=1 Tax=Sphingomonas sp. C3-2 TaxID=3062169 RepID=UPI00294AEA2A|nr:rhomboid family intramembrane serine protease [Sphingomonas sp. C3-2]WOK36979.1 rhomboid family intramembrane serine protease [Sphingomonas sp. C3-2]
MRLPQGKLTNALVIITSAFWLLATVLGLQDYAAGAMGMMPARISGALVLEGALPAWLTPLSATLVHADLIHLGFNMLMLVYCGRFVELALGVRGLALLYVIGAYAAGAAEYFWSPASLVPMVGASGAISAVFGAYAMLFGRNDVSAVGPATARFIRIIWLAVAWIAIQGLVAVASWGTMTRIAIAAHIGGFIAGLLLARPLLLLRFRRA